MRPNTRQHGFSLLETLMAVSTLAIGMIFVGGTFLTGIYLATVSTERTIATVVADEALAKIRLYGGLDDADLSVDECTLYTDLADIPISELWYPSLDANDVNSVREYSWAALCRRQGDGSRLTQVTVFVSRRAGTNARYWARDPNTSELEQMELPHPVRVNVVQDADDEDDELTIEDAVTSDETEEYTFINDGATIVDNETGQIYRVLERYAEPPERIKLDRPWAGTPLTGSDGGWVWVVPRPVAGGRSPQVAVYQEVMRF